jgi:redox-sensitive bicupin YhaK (pirin superfamily)
LPLPVPEKHGDYIFVIEGSIKIGDKVLNAGDSAQVSKTDAIDIQTLAGVYKFIALI